METEYRLGLLDQPIYKSISENLTNVLRETQTDIKQSEIRLDKPKNTGKWLDAIPDMKFEYDKINQIKDTKKETGLPNMLKVSMSGMI